MAGFAYGEELICLERVTIDRTAYKPGEIFPYQEMTISMDLIESLLNSRKIARKSLVTPAMLKEAMRDRTSKVIKNNFRTGERIAVSWPADEPLPKGVTDGRRNKKPIQQEAEPVVDAPKPFEPEVDEQELPPDDFPKDVEMVSYGGGWYDVKVNGNVVNEKKLRKRDALKLKRSYE